MGEWKTIDSAPKRIARPVLLHCTTETDRFDVVGIWSDRAWRDIYGGEELPEPSHWAELPPPPPKD